MKRILFLLITLTVIFSGCKKDSVTDPETYRFKFQFITENYKPLNYQEGGELKGLAPDLLREICAALGVPFKADVLQWEQGYQTTLSTGNAVLFSTILNSSRKDLFKWAGPIASLDWSFYSNSPASISLKSLDDAKVVQRIGVIKDYAIEQYLLEQGFTNLVYVNNNIEAFDKLLKGEIDLYPSDKITAEAALQSLNKTIWSVTPLLTILTDLVYFAFNKEVPDDVVADFQREIDKLKDNGTLSKLYQKHMHQQNPPATLQIYTEQYPPLTYRNSFGEITGFGTDVVNEIMKRNQVYYPITLSLWSNAYTMIQNNPNFCLFTMDRTAARDTIFQWVGPIGSNVTYFFTKSGSGITITSINDAKNLQSVGTVSSWFSDQYLRQLGFTNLVSDPDPVIMTKKLMQGEINTFVCSAVTFPDILKEAGYQYSQVVPAFSLMSSDYYIAFSKSTPAGTVSQWQTALTAIKQDGSYDAIYHKWFP
ncbi:MAG TPA: transporter substrate-binding domain-containing protein [Ignavibacteriaceae bacterium]|nr:transporter substrate-binding domain-containing protein [Ignavibacteriaceae bacterium]